jgi:hypothetical protein
MAGFVLGAGGLLVPERVRAYSFTGGWSEAMASVFVNGQWRAWIGQDLRVDRRLQISGSDVVRHDAARHYGHQYILSPCAFADEADERDGRMKPDGHTYKQEFLGLWTIRGEVTQPMFPRRCAWFGQASL